MRLRFLSVLAASTMLAMVGVASASAGGARPAASARGQATAKPWTPNLTILVNQIGSPGGFGINSQDFTDAPSDPFDDQAADDFTIPAGKKWKVQGMRSVGFYYNGTGPCASETVSFYKGDGPGGVPGTPVATRSGVGTNAAGVLTLVFSTPVIITVAGHYWVSMQCVMDFSVGGQWAWTDRTIASGTNAQWQNPKGGFAVCPTWGSIQTCNGVPASEPDLQYALAGAAM
jgi:hypothetical protein